jgi:acyl-CoA thioesterase-1
MGAVMAHLSPFRQEFLSYLRGISSREREDGRAEINRKNPDSGRFGRFLIALAISLLASCQMSEAWARPAEIVALGDSNTAGDGVGERFAWPALVETMLRGEGLDVTIRNAGVSGDTTDEALARLDRAVPENTDAAIVFLGRNDMRVGAPVERTNANIEKLVSQLRKRGIEVLLIGFEPYDFSAIAAAQGASYYPDFFAGVAKNGKKLRRYVLPLDLVHHLNASGHKVVAENLLPAVRELVKRAAD